MFKSKIFLLMAMIIFCFALADTITITKTCNIRSDTNFRTKDNIVGVAEKGQTYEVLDTYGDYVELKVVQGATDKETSDHAGKQGYMWSHRVDRANGNVIIEGCTLRSSPEKKDNGTPKDTADDPNFVCKVKRGAKVNILRVVVTYYKIGEKKWVCALYANKN